MWATLLLQGFPASPITPGHTNHERHLKWQQCPPTQCPSHELWDSLRRRWTLLLVSLKFQLSVSWEWSCCLSPGIHESLWYLAAQGRSTASKPSLCASPYLVSSAQLGALLITDVNSSESLWAFVPLAFYQSGKVPQLLQPEGPGATHVISSLQGRFPFHCFTQACMGHPLNSTRVPKSSLKWGIRRPWTSEQGHRPKGLVAHNAAYSTQIVE